MIFTVSLKIIESYVKYSPLLDYSKITKRLLATVPEKYFIGLDSVVLCNLSGQPRRLRTGTLPRRGRRIRRENVAGLYHGESRGQKAWIQVFVDQITMPPRPFLWIRPLREAFFGLVLYHELGHHAHTIRPEYREKEDVADSWGHRFLDNHLRQSYWFFYRVLRVVRFLRKVILRLNNSNAASASSRA